MRVSIIGSRFSSSSAASPSVPSSAGQGNFQAAAPAPSLIRSYFQNAPAGAAPSLGSQTILALLHLQAQELEEAEAHGHGSGSGHHGETKMMSGMEGGEATESEEAALLRRRRKLLKTFNGTDVKETDETENPDATDTKRPRKNGHNGKGPIQ